MAAGETLTLTCTMSGGGPVGAVRWLKGLGSGNKTVYEQKGSFPRVTRVVNESGTDFSIHIRDVRPEDAGTYYCVKFEKLLLGDKVFQRGNGTEVSVRGEWGSRWEPALPGAAPSPAQPGGLCLGRAGMGKGLGGRSQERVPWAVPGRVRAPAGDPAPCSPGAGSGWQSPV